MQKVRCIFYNNQMEVCSLGHTKDQCSPDCLDFALEEEIDNENQFEDEELE